jgi:hypothetical protein
MAYPTIVINKDLFPDQLLLKESGLLKMLVKVSYPLTRIVQ